MPEKVFQGSSPSYTAPYEPLPLTPSAILLDPNDSKSACPPRNKCSGKEMTSCSRPPLVLLWPSSCPPLVLPPPPPPPDLLLYPLGLCLMPLYSHTREQGQLQGAFSNRGEGTSKAKVDLRERLELAIPHPISLHPSPTPPRQLPQLPSSSSPTRLIAIPTS